MNDLIHIIEGCKRKELHSQEKLYHQFYPALYALCKSFFDDKHEALTALNNGMLRVFNHIHQYDAEKGSFFNWVYTIVRNSALTRLRDLKTRPLHTGSDFFPETPQDDPFGDPNKEGLYEMLGSLPRTTRTICSLYYFEGFSIREIAASLDMKDGTVKWHLNESRRRLKNLLQPKIVKSA